MERETVKQILVFFKTIDNEIAYNARIVADYEEQYYSVSGGRLMDGMPKSKYKISNPTESTVLNIPDSVSAHMRELNAEINGLGKLKKAVLSELNKLPFLQKSIIYDFYIQGFQWVQISGRIHYSPTQCKNIRNRGLDKLGKHFSHNKTISSFNYPA